MAADRRGTVRQLAGLDRPDPGHVCGQLFQYCSFGRQPALDLRPAGVCTVGGCKGQARGARSRSTCPPFANNRHHLGFLNPPIDQPLSPHLLFFLDPGRAYKVMQVYLFLLASWQAQCKLIAMYPAVVDVLSGLSFLPDVQPNWDTAISILPLAEYAYQDNSDYRPPPLIMFQRFMRVRVIDVATITQACSRA